MLSFLSGLLSGILNLLGTLLPDSPFKDMAEVPESINTGIGWLNWFFPVGDCMLMMGLALTACVAYVAVRFVMGKALTVTGKLVG